MTWTHLKTYSSLITEATINISPKAYSSLDLEGRYAVSFCSQIMMLPPPVVLPFLICPFPTSSRMRDSKLLGEGRLCGWVGPGLCEPRAAKSELFPGTPSFQWLSRQGWRGAGGECMCRVYCTSSPTAVESRCTEAFVENGWALGPQQMWWEIEPGGAGMEQERRHGGPAKPCKVTTGGNLKKNEDIPTSARKEG